MHSSRMRTDRRSGHLGGRGVCLLGGACLFTWRGCFLTCGGVWLPGGSVWARHTPRQTPIPPWAHQPLYTTPLPVNRMTDRCKNITFSGSLRYAVGNKEDLFSYNGGTWRSFWKTLNFTVWELLLKQTNFDWVTCQRIAKCTCPEVKGAFRVLEKLFNTVQSNRKIRQGNFSRNPVRVPPPNISVN